MYGYEWTDQNGIYRLIPNAKVKKEIRPVFKEELDYFGFDKHWRYPDTDAPLLWAEGIRRYVLNGEVVAEAKGGSFYSKPVVVVKREGIDLSPIDIDALWDANERLMLGLEKTAIEFVRKVHDTYKNKNYKFVVAFSGGKDSIVLLDIVSKALRPDEFFVIFSNTGMELSSTLRAVERAKERWSKLRFYEAKSHIPPDESWNEFGPPGRRLRWCCSVHKSVPTILKLREIIGDYDARAVVFDGIRKEESSARSQYAAVSEGAKNINQNNASPLLDWGTAELYLSLLKNDLILNEAYRYGLSRVGCMVCPMSSDWWDGIANDKYRSEMAPFLAKIDSYAKHFKPEKEVKKYITAGGWKARMGGRGLANGGNRISEVIEDDSIIFYLSVQNENWLELCKIIGNIVDIKDDQYTQIINGKTFYFELSENTIKYFPYSSMDRFVVSHLRSLANKAAYCVHCMACVVQCPTGAFDITDHKKIVIRENKCIHCLNCISFTGWKGCLASRALSITGGISMTGKSINPYQHFGFRQPWLEHFFELGVACFSKGALGNRQYDSLKAWLREAELLELQSNKVRSGMPTRLGEKLMKLNPNNPLVWAVIWTNLAYNSIICRWYMENAEVGTTYSKTELVAMLGTDYSESTKENAITALAETLRQSPIGTSLRQGIPIGEGKIPTGYYRQGWESPEALAIVYALYRFAKAVGRYTFTLADLAKSRSDDNIKGISPATIFGIPDNEIKSKLEAIAISSYGDLIRNEFQRDLDAIILTEYRNFPEAERNALNTMYPETSDEDKCLLKIVDLIQE